MTSGLPIVFLVQRIGPYHHARLAAWAASRRGKLHVIEFRPADEVYAWPTVTGAADYVRTPVNSIPTLLTALNTAGPAAVVCVGYSDPEVHHALAWAQRRSIPLVVCSDSNRHDEPRRWIKEWFKRCVVAGFDGGLVAGSAAAAYLSELGVPEARQRRSWDVVDNDHFARGAAAARSDPATVRQRYRLPEQFFICVARFVPKKNLGRLIEAYASYRSHAGTSAWSLVLAGSGPLVAELKLQVKARGCEANVQFRGVGSYEELPWWYGLAGAAVLPSLVDQWGLVVNEAMAAGLPVLVSNTCGCTPELLEHGKNGYGFDPRNSAEMAARLSDMTLLAPEKRRMMAEHSALLIRPFSPAAFARGAEEAVDCATRYRASKPKEFGRAVLGLLRHRPI